MKKLTSHKEMLDKYVGKEGIPERERFEAELKAEILSAKIKELRLKRKMTQEQLAKLIGKDKTQISKIERGRNLTIATIVQVVEALGGKINFEIEFAGVV